MNKISVCIPVYNGAAFIERAIQSVVNQSWKNVEIIVQDNASTDSTWELLLALVKVYPQLRIERNKTNIGMSPNWNRVLERASGDFLMLLSADDWLRDTFLRKCMQEFDRHPVAAVTANHVLLQRNGRTRSRRVRIRTGMYQNFVSLVLLQNPFSINFTVWLRSALDALKIRGTLFRQTIYTCDYDLWLRVARNGAIVSYLEEPLGVYRIHQANLSSHTRRMLRHTTSVLTSNRRGLLQSAPFAYRFTIGRLLVRALHKRAGMKSDKRLMRVLFLRLLQRALA